MSQNILATAWCSLGLQGINCQVSGSGIATISLSSIRANPWMDDPSKPIPCSRAPSNSPTVMAKPFKTPRISVNHSLTNLTSCSLAILRTYCLPSSLFLFSILDLLFIFALFDFLHIVLSPSSPVLVRTTLSIGRTNILPALILPVLAAIVMARSILDTSGG